jgi:hypothetical protein
MDGDVPATGAHGKDRDGLWQACVHLPLVIRAGGSANRLTRCARAARRFGSVIVVLCERVGGVNSYAILAVRPATPEEVKQWMEGTR